MTDGPILATRSLKCTRCGLRLRAAWQPLRRAIVKAAALRKAAR